MNELIPITYTNDRPTVSGRALHDALEVQTPYNKWFPRMCEYGFTAGSDFQEVSDKIVQNPQGGRPATDHQITIGMAKQLCMLQRNDKGAQFRQYFIDVENQWNSPEAVMARALQMANRQLDTIKDRVKLLEVRNGELLELNAAQNQQLAEMRPKAGYYDVVLNCKDSVSATVIAKDYGWSAKKLNAFLREKKVQYKQGRTWVLYQKYAEQGYTTTKTPTYLGSDGEQHATIHTYWTQKGRLFIYDLMEEGLKERLALYNNWLVAANRMRPFSVTDVDVRFTLSLPINEPEIVQLVTSLQGIVDDQTLLSQLWFIKDPAEAVENIRKQQAEKQKDYQATFGLPHQADTDEEEAEQ